MKFLVTSSKNQAYEMEFTGPREGIINGVPFQIEWVKENGPQVVLLINRKPYLAEVKREDRVYTVLLNGKEFRYTVETAYLAGRREAISVVKEAETIRAPISGKIVAILVEEGQRVHEGDVLLILEAMKMENEIQAIRSGKIEKILVKEEESVTTGQELVVIV